MKGGANEEWGRAGDVSSRGRRGVRVRGGSGSSPIPGAGASGHTGVMTQQNPNDPYSAGSTYSTGSYSADSTYSADPYSTDPYTSDPYSAGSYSARTESWRSTLPRRSRRRLIAGVCGGLAEHWGVSPTLVRLATLLLSLLPGPMWVVYVAAWIVMPDAD